MSSESGEDSEPAPDVAPDATTNFAASQMDSQAEVRNGLDVSFLRDRGLSCDRVSDAR
jgi:hypothetical protein